MVADEGIGLCSGPPVSEWERKCDETTACVSTTPVVERGSSCHVQLEGSKGTAPAVGHLGKVGNDEPQAPKPRPQEPMSSRPLRSCLRQSGERERESERESDLSGAVLSQCLPSKCP